MKMLHVLFNFRFNKTHGCCYNNENSEMNVRPSDCPNLDSMNKQIVHVYNLAS